MQNMPDNTNTESNSGTTHPSAGSSSSSRTAAAALEFIHALSSDLAALATRLWQCLARAGARARDATARARSVSATPKASWMLATAKVLQRFGLLSVLTCIVAMLAVWGAML